MHHHGTDGTCHDGLYCGQCDSDIEEMHQTLLDHQARELTGPDNIPVTIIDTDPLPEPQWNWPSDDG